MKKQQKSHVILLELIRGRTLNRFEAERHGDHCLNSTISELEKKFGIRIDRQRENVPCRAGQVNVNRYSLKTPEARYRAAELLAAELVAKGKFQSEVDAMASIGLI